MKNTIFKYAVACLDDISYDVLGVFDTIEEAKDLIERRIEADKLLSMYNLWDYNYEYCIVFKEVKVNDSI